MDIYEDEQIDVSDNALRMIADLALQQTQAEKKVEALQHQLKEANKVLDGIRFKALPDAMAAVKMKSFTLEDGSTVKIARKLFASIPKAKKGLAIDWLVEHGHSSLIEDTVSMGFKRGQHDKMLELVQLLQANKYDPHVDRAVNTARVKALIKELEEDGKEVPLETFGAFWQTGSEIK